MNRLLRTVASSNTSLFPCARSGAGSTLPGRFVSTLMDRTRMDRSTLHVPSMAFRGHVILPPGVSLTCRGMAKKSGNWSGDRYSSDNRKSGGVPAPQNPSPKKTDTLKLQFCWTPYDLEMDNDGDMDDEDEMDDMYTTSKFDLKEIKLKAKEMFDSNTDLEYWNGTAWMPLTNIQALSSFRGTNRPVPLRVPEVFDEHEYEDDDNENDEMGDEDGMYNDDMNDYTQPKDPAQEMRATIVSLVQTLQSLGYAPSPTLPHTLVNRKDDTTIATSDWILQHAHAAAVAVVQDDDDDDDETEQSTSLDQILLGHVGALPHMVQCLHYDWLWVTHDAQSNDTVDTQES